MLPIPPRPPAAAESFSITNATIGGRRVIIAAGRDPRGLTYALLELTDRLEYESSHAAVFQIARPIVEQPAIRIRCVLRAFVSEVDVKPWFYDRGGWRDYLTMLATHRFNRFNLKFRDRLRFRDGNSRPPISTSHIRFCSMFRVITFRWRLAASRPVASRRC